jgi:hypothetical protein
MGALLAAAALRVGSAGQRKAPAATTFGKAAS